MERIESQGRKPFHKASYSQGASNCVEVSEGATTAVRDTQNRDLGHLEFTGGEWAALRRALTS